MIDSNRTFIVPKQHQWLAKLGLLSIAYLIWVSFVRLLTLTLITYFSVSPATRTPGAPGVRFQDISDVFGSNEVVLMGMAAFLFVGLLHWANPFSPSRLTDVLNRFTIEKNFLPGFVQGTIFAGAMTLAFLLTGAYRYLGSFIQFSDAPLELANVAFRMFALASLTFCEEYLFRERMVRYADEFMPHSITALLVSVLYCGIKLFQFDLGLAHLCTLFLISISLSYRARKEGTFARGAGFWAGILILFHPILSLPVFGNDFTGVLLLKSQIPNAGWETQESGFPLARFLTGGAGGPLSSVAFQLLLILDIGRSIVRSRKEIEQKL